MESPPFNPTILTNLLSTQEALLNTLTSFLTVCVHHILYLRKIYPPISFASTRAYNYPIRQNRHSDVCSWIDDAIAAVRDQLEKNTVEKVALCIFECDKNRVLERWTFDLHAFPVVAKDDHEIRFEQSPENAELEQEVNLADLEATFRATLSQITVSAMKLRDLPEGDGAPECSFTITIEVKDRADRPVGRSEEEACQWIAAEPDSYNGSNNNTKANGRDLHKEKPGKTHPVRRLEAGEMRLEVWVEESSAKYSYATTEMTTGQRAAAMSYGYGWGVEKFDPEVGYPLEPRNINRNAGDGIGTDYQRS